MPEYPSGTVAFLFTDIEGSTRRWERQQQAMWAAVERHFALLRGVIEAHNGVLFKTVGDAVQAAFPTVPDAIAAAADAQRALHDAEWGDIGRLRVRMAIHVGEATPVAGDYLAPVLNRLARVLGAGHGNQVLLTEAAQTLAISLPPEHGLLDLGRHQLRDLLVAEHIYQLTGPGLPLDLPPLKSLERQPHNLPAQPTELIGREAELETLRSLLTSPETRLVTLTGPGGTGKTRLAVQAAADVAESFPDGVWWVPAATLTDPALVLEAIAAPLGVREVPGEPLLTTLTDHFRSQRTLLVLDNLEQVLGAAAPLGHLLAGAAGLRMLATSREPLRLRGEREFPVPPLDLPLGGRTITAETAAASPAVQLFVARAQAIKPNFALSDDNAEAIAAICARLDGLPLAIELAAARVRLLPPAALLSRLEKRLSLLTGGARDLPERQQTLRAAIAWSHDLLAVPEQTLFARLAVFTGGCTFEAAEAVAMAGAAVDIDLLDGLEGLVQKSLLRQSDEPAGEPRFAMLETIREFGLDQLATRPSDETAVRSAHAAFFRALVAQAVNAEDQTSSYDQLEIEAGNLRETLDWLTDHAEPAAALETARDLRWFWWVRGHLREGQTRLEAALRRTAGAPPEVRASALGGLGALLEASGAYARARGCYEEALALSREAGDELGIAEALDNLGTIASVEGDLDRATSLREEALALRRSSGDRRGIAVSLINLGTVAYQEGDADRASALFTEARDLSRAAGDQWLLATALGNLGGALSLQARLASGEELPSLQDTTEVETQAAMLLREALALWRDLGDREGILDCLLSLATIAARTDGVRAARLLGAAEALAAATGHQLAPIDPDQHDRLVASARTGLGAEAFDAARREGARLSLAEAIAAALALD